MAQYDDEEAAASLIKPKSKYGSVPEKADDEDEEEEAQPRSLMGIFLIVLGSFSFSCMFLFVKLMQGTANSFTLVFYRSLVQIALSLTPLLIHGINPLGERSVRGWLLVRGGFGSGAVIAFFYAIQNLTLPDAVTLQFTTPIFAAAFAVCLAGERWMPLDVSLYRG
jgi:drug/metabolite transporter (DMT)-like permease